MQSKLSSLSLKYPPPITKWHLQLLLCMSAKIHDVKGQHSLPFGCSPLGNLPQTHREGTPAREQPRQDWSGCCTLNFLNKGFLKCLQFGPYFPELLNATTYLLKREQLFPALCHISINNHTFPVCLSSFHNTPCTSCSF